MGRRSEHPGPHRPADLAHRFIHRRGCGGEPARAARAAAHPRVERRRCRDRSGIALHHQLPEEPVRTARYGAQRDRGGGQGVLRVCGVGREGRSPLCGCRWCGIPRRRSGDRGHVRPHRLRARSQGTAGHQSRRAGAPACGRAARRLTHPLLSGGCDASGCGGGGARSGGSRAAAHRGDRGAAAPDHPGRHHGAGARHPCRACPVAGARPAYWACRTHRRGALRRRHVGAGACGVAA